MKSILLMVLCATALSCSPGAKAPTLDEVAKVLCGAVPTLLLAHCTLADEVYEYAVAVCNLTAEQKAALKAPEAVDAGAE